MNLSKKSGIALKTLFHVGIKGVSIGFSKKDSPAVEIKKNPDIKEKKEKSKTVAEIDRDKLEKKFSSKKEETLN